jgi:hypothetical protein
MNLSKLKRLGANKRLVSVSELEFGLEILVTRIGNRSGILMEKSIPRHRNLVYIVVKIQTSITILKKWKNVN